MKKIKVSVCIPVYGVEQYIERCARSLFEQTMEDGIEFIFVNDCTPDKSIDILQQVLEEYPHRKKQVTILHHEQNKGLAASRKTALAIAQGDYIIHCDSDDWVDLNMYEAMYNKAIAENADMVYCSIIIKLLSGKSKYLLSKKYTSPREMFFNSFHTPDFNTLCNKLFIHKIACSSDIIVPEHICMGEDLLRTSQMLLQCNNISCIPTVFYHYIKNNDSITKEFDIKLHRQILDVVDILRQRLSSEYRSCIDYTYHNILFDSILYNKKYYSEFKKMWGFSFWVEAKLHIYSNPTFSIPKKMILYCACINYALTCKIFNLFYFFRKTIRKC